MAKISQREARRLKRRVEELEAAENIRRYAWATEWPGGVHLNTLTMGAGATVVREVLTARKLGHAVIAVPEGETQLRLLALPLHTSTT